MIKKEFTIANKKFVVETGRLAKQANSSVLVKLGDTAVLTTVVMSKQPLPEMMVGDGIRLMVDYRERNYAVGKIPGGFFKREGRPTEREILNSRIVDRSIRPLFPIEMYQYEVQINSIVLSFDNEHDPVIPALLGASTALTISEIPFNGPVACCYLAQINNQFMFNVNINEQNKDSIDLELFIANVSNNKTLMIEADAKEMDEATVINGLKFAQPYLDELIKIQLDMQKETGKQKLSIPPMQIPADIVKLIDTPELRKQLVDTLTIIEKPVREKQLEQNKHSLIDMVKKIVPEKIKSGEYSEQLIEKYVSMKYYDIEQQVVRKYILDNKIRLDKRKLNEIRPISCETGVLPRTHGSALFTRGQTQALVTVTLGTVSDMQIHDNIEGEIKEGFLFHYNFPGFATGEIKPERGTSRRETGHGALAKRGIVPLIPQMEEFPYTIRLVSDILESNGSSSMASVCGGSLALFDAGVNIKSAVAGVALGLITGDDKYVILTDIAGIEDHVGDMDFKVAGTANGITAIQMDLKIQGIDLHLIEESLAQSKTARLEILKIMNNCIAGSRNSLSAYAPKIVIVQIPISKIGELIGPGGKNIKKIIEETSAQVEIEDDGKVFISGTDDKAIAAAKAKVEPYAMEPEIGKIYHGKVVKIMEFGAFVEIYPGKEGLVHISQLDIKRVQNVTDVVKEGDDITVKLIDIDDRGRLVLSRKVLL